MYDSNALLRMRQSVEDLSTNVEKRVAFAPRFAPSSGVDYTSLQLKQAVQDEQSYASAHVPYPHCTGSVFFRTIFAVINVQCTIFLLADFLRTTYAEAIH